jgi:hypothetical protein
MVHSIPIFLPKPPELQAPFAEMKRRELTGKKVSPADREFNLRSFHSLRWGRVCISPAISVEHAILPVCAFVNSYTFRSPIRPGTVFSPIVDNLDLDGNVHPCQVD